MDLPLPLLLLGLLAASVGGQSTPATTAHPARPEKMIAPPALLSADAAAVVHLREASHDGKTPSGWEISGAGRVRFQTPTAALRRPVRFVQFALRPAIHSDSTQNTRLNLSGAEIAFSTYQDSDGAAAFQLQVRTTSGDWENTSLWYRLDQNLDFPLVPQWTLRIDDSAGSFDLFLNRALWMANIPLTGARGENAILSSGPKPAFLAALQVTPDNPLFPDADTDGIPDAFEEKFGRPAGELQRHDPVGGPFPDLLSAYMRTFGRF